MIRISINAATIPLGFVGGDRSLASRSSDMWLEPRFVGPAARYARP
jgi:hypothetical protein